MPAPFPPESAAGGKQYAQRAEIVYRAYVDIARVSNDIANVDAEVSLEKVAQLAFVYGPTLNAEASDGSTEFRAAVYSRMQRGGIEWLTPAVMVTDLLAIRAECNAFKAWVEANLPEALTPAVVTYSTVATTFSVVPGVVENPSKKSQTQTEVAKVRALYT